MKFNLTPVQIIGLVLVINGALIGSTAQLTDLFGPVAVKYIIAIASIGNSIFGGIITMVTGQGSQIRNVLAMPGVEKISVNGQASPALATLAVDPAQDKIAPTTAAMDKVTATAAKAVILLAVLLTGMLTFTADARAQTQPRLTGNLVRDIAAAQNRPNPATPGLTGNPLGDIIGALDVKLLPDLTYALKLATASGSKVTGPCYQAWIDIINVRQKAVQDDSVPPQALPMPDPHLVTDFEKLVELRNSLQPDSEFMIKCSPVASMVKKDIVGFIGIVISGGAGLATLVPGL